MKLTIDSSVFVEAVAGTIHKKLCNDLLLTVYKTTDIEIYEPSILFFEFTCAISNSSADPNTVQARRQRMDKALKICEVFQKRPSATYSYLDESTWEKWRSDLIKHNYQTHHKTQDELFLSAACMSEATLVTLDQGMIKKPECLMGKVTVISPYDCLKLIEQSSV